MKFFYSPGACSLSIHALLEEVGWAYEAQEISLRKKEQFSPSYLAINPKAQVPALQRDDGSVLTELVAIAVWVADSNPSLGLMPSAPEDRARAFEIMMHVTTNIHPQGFTRIHRTDKFTPNQADYEAIRERGREIVKEGIAHLNSKLPGRPTVLGELSIADFVAFYIEYWTAHRLQWQLPENCATHLRGMLSRPSVTRALGAENLPVIEI